MSPLFGIGSQYISGIRGMSPPRSPPMEMGRRGGGAQDFPEGHKSSNKSYSIKARGERGTRLPRILGRKSFNGNGVEGTGLPYFRGTHLPIIEWVFQMGWGWSRGHTS